MGIEIERKFLVRSEAWRALGQPVRIRQGYLSVDKERTVRVRTLGSTAKLTIKGRSVGTARAEYEYDLPVDEANELLDGLCLRPLLDKTRTTLVLGAHTWEVDEFFGENAGLVVAEVELRAADEHVELPAWVGAEVSRDARYFNANLIAHPFSRW